MNQQNYFFERSVRVARKTEKAERKLREREAAALERKRARLATEAKSAGSDEPPRRNVIRDL